MRVIIIGGTAAGTSVAFKAKRTNPDLEILLYEKSKTISFGSCGLPYFIGGFFDDPDEMISRTPEQAIEYGIDLKILHEVISIDTKNNKIIIKDIINNKIIEDTYDKLVICSGSSPVVLPFSNKDLKNIFTLKTLEDGENIKEELGKDNIKNVVIVGGGFIGLELCDTIHKLNKNIRLIQLEKSIMPDSLDKEVTDILEEEIRNKKINLHLEEKVIGFEGDAKVKRVVTDKGIYEADLVILCTGVKPETKFLDDKIEVKKGAIIIDEFGKTNIENVYSAGDCATVFNPIIKKDLYIPLATGANKIGRIVGHNIASDSNNQMKYWGSLGTSFVQVFDLEVGRTGITEKEAQNLNLDYSTSFVKDQNRSGYLGSTFDIYVKLIYDKKSREILGGQVVGYKDAAMRSNVLATAIYNKMTVDELGFLDLGYAPPFSRTWDVLNTAGNASK